MKMMKKTEGKKKIEMKKIDKRSSLQVTFSKRRAGLFRKASELCVLTGAETAIIAESPGGRVFAFGNPSVDSVVDQYLAGSSEKPQEDARTNEADINSTEKFNQEYLKITKEMEDEKAKKINVVENQPFWWEQPFDNLGVEELEEYISSLEALKNNVLERANKMNMIGNSSMFNINPSSNSEGLDMHLAHQNAGHYEFGNQQMHPCPPGFNTSAGLNRSCFSCFLI